VKSAVEWTDALLAEFADICRVRWGLRFRTSDASFLSERLERAFQASTAETVDEFAKLVGSAPDSAPEVQALVSQLAVGETSFFRYQPQFRALAREILPELASRRRASGDLRIRVWSAGCSTGEEPYSIAILLTQVLPDWERWNIEILATDVNPFALRRAEDAIYSAWSFRNIDPDALADFFVSVGRTRRLVHRCRSMVRFRLLNLATATIPEDAADGQEFDVVFCRNVMIYFDDALTRKLANAFYDALAPGGWLFVGHTEPDSRLFERFELREYPDTLLYRKSIETTDSPAPDVAADGALPDLERRTLGDESTGSPAPPELPAAMSAYDEGDLESAYEVLLAVHLGDATDPTPAHLLAQVCADRRQFDEALYWAFTALYRNPFHVATLILMGLVQVERGEPHVALTNFRKAIFLEPTCPEAHYYLSIAQRACGDDHLAERSRERALRLCKDAPVEDLLLPVQRTRKVLCAT
jgi:chemotaxis protein methyltransferase CheR